MSTSKTEHPSLPSPPKPTKRALLWGAHIHTLIPRILHTDHLTLLEVTVRALSWKQSPWSIDNGRKWGQQFKLKTNLSSELN